MICIGCGHNFPAIDGPTHRYMLSSPGCWARFGELLTREYENSAYMPVHRLTVDTYAVQHPGVDTPQARNSVGIHLSRLYLLLERGWPMVKANDAMLHIIAKKFAYPWLLPPAKPAKLSLEHVLKTSTPETHALAVKEWALSVWQNWKSHHSTVHSWTANLP